jgi:hypothetical protein
MTDATVPKPGVRPSEAKALQLLETLKSDPSFKKITERSGLKGEYHDPFLPKWGFTKSDGIGFAELEEISREESHKWLTKILRSKSFRSSVASLITESVKNVAFEERYGISVRWMDERGPFFHLMPGDSCDAYPSDDGLGSSNIDWPEQADLFAIAMISYLLKLYPAFEKCESDPNAFPDQESTFLGYLPGSYISLRDLQRRKWD